MNTVHTPGPDITDWTTMLYHFREDSIKFNQISGKVLIGYIVKNELKTIEVMNAITLLLPGKQGPLFG